LIRTAKITALLILFLGLSACATKKKKGEVSWMGKTFHNTTARYNGYYNADLLLQETFLNLGEQHEDNYTQILDLYPYAAVDNPKAAAPQLDRAIEKVTTVAALHEPSKWVDDCYLLMGKAQYLKQDFETAEETFEYFIEEFDPHNPNSRLFQAAKKDAKKNRKDQTKQKNEDRKNAREEAKKLREEEKKEAAKLKEEERKRKEKEREEARKKKEEERKAKKKRGRSKDKKRSTKRRKPKQETKTEPEKTEDLNKEEKKEEVVETKSEIPKETSLPKPVEVEKEEVIEDKLPEPRIITGTDEAWAAGESKDEKINKKPSTGGGGLFKHQIAYYEGTLWMVKTYIERGKYFSAEYLLKKLKEFGDLPDEVKREIPVAEAYLALKQKKYRDAVPALEKAIDAAKDKALKARYAYIQAQIYQMYDQGDKAFASFERAKKFKPGFDMEFNADLSMAKNSWTSGKKSPESVLKKLDGMLNEDKYLDHADQIYYTKGEVKLKSGDKAGAIEEFKNSIAYNQFNVNQKIESYYILAELFYNDEEYAFAKNYYDSTLVLIPKLDERHSQVEKFSKNLVEIVKNIEIIALQDSLLLIAEMSQEDKLALAKKILEEQKLANESSQNPVAQNKPKRPSSRRAGQLSSFFAYNPITLEQGKRDFNSKWGSRALADNWRRSNELTSVFEEELALEEEETEDTADMRDEEIQAILRGVPRGEEQKMAAHGKIQDAMIALGSLYRNKIQNAKKSVEILEEYLLRYPGTEKEIDALFGLYLSNLDIPDQAKASFYKNLLLEKYPETKYASILHNPNFMEELRKEENKSEEYYQQTYQVFLEGNYPSAFEKIQKGKTLLEKGHPLRAKFDLLEAMCIGNIEGQEKYVASLRQINTKYPNTEESTRAREIIRFLEGDDSAFDPILYEEALEQFSLQDDRLHYIIFVVNGLAEEQVQTMKNDIVKYNRDYHKLDRLRAPSEIYIDRETKAMIVLLRKFNNKSKAMDYYDGALKNKDVFINTSIPYEMFAVTQQNYREILKQKSVNSYRVFFQANYLEN
jgi:hypothetical protein